MEDVQQDKYSPDQINLKPIKNNTEQLQGRVSPQQIEDWKEKYGKVYTYTVDGMIAYLRSVDRNLYSKAAAKVSVSPAKFNEIVIEGIWLGGDDTIRKVDQYFFGLIDFVEELMGKKRGELGEC